MLLSMLLCSGGGAVGMSGIGSTVLGVKWTRDEPEVTCVSMGRSGGGMELDPRPN